MDRRMERLRNEIDRIDDSILQLFKERMRLVDRVADEKMTARIPVTLPMREQAILLRIAEEAGPELAPYAKLLFMAMFAASRSWQSKRMRPKTGYLSAKIGQALRAMPDKLFPAGATVAGSGVRDSFSQTACEGFFRRSASCTARITGAYSARSTKACASSAWCRFNPAALAS